MTVRALDGRGARLADRREIYDLLVRCACAMDSFDWLLLEACFSPGATADFGELAPRGEDRGETIGAIRAAMADLDTSQHFLGNIRTELERDTATCTSYLHALQPARSAAGDGTLTTVIARYRDRVVRTPDGWRIQHRILTTGWVDGHQIGRPDA